MYVRKMLGVQNNNKRRKADDTKYNYCNNQILPTIETISDEVAIT